MTREQKEFLEGQKELLCKSKERAIALLRVLVADKALPIFYNRLAVEVLKLYDRASVGSVVGIPTNELPKKKEEKPKRVSWARGLVP